MNGIKCEEREILGGRMEGEGEREGEVGRIELE
jgi:hypothetical protein